MILETISLNHCRKVWNVEQQTHFSSVL